MTYTERHPGVQHRGGVEDQLGGEVSSERSPPNRRSTASWSQRHRSRVNRIFTELDTPAVGHWTGDREWSASELRAVELAAAHLRDLTLYGGWQCPESARQAWRCKACPCNREAG
jgi:hypothetical protein